VAGCASAPLNWPGEGSCARCRPGGGLTVTLALHNGRSKLPVDGIEVRIAWSCALRECCALCPACPGAEPGPSSGPHCVPLSPSSACLQLSLKREAVAYERPGCSGGDTRRFFQV